MGCFAVDTIVQEYSCAMPLVQQRYVYKMDVDAYAYIIQTLWAVFFRYCLCSAWVFFRQRPPVVFAGRNDYKESCFSFNGRL